MGAKRCPTRNIMRNSSNNSNRKNNSNVVMYTEEGLMEFIGIQEASLAWVYANYSEVWDDYIECLTGWLAQHQTALEELRSRNSSR